MVQGLHAFARGGILGTGLGAGLPEVGGLPPGGIPALHTDFPFAALGEELGLIGVVAILGLYLVVIERGLRIAASATDEFQAILAAGLSLVIGVQAFIIAAGNLKLIPLTGITLPFISYGGSSLLTNGLVVGLLMALSDQRVGGPAAAGRRPRATPARIGPRRGVTAGGTAPGTAAGPASRRPPVGATLGRIGVAMSLAFGALAAGAGYWQVWRASDLSSAPDDAAVIAAGRRVERGEIFDRDGKRLAWSVQDEHGEPHRRYLSASVSGVIGYASLLYGTAGLERAYDAELTGVTSADPVQDLLKKFRSNPSDPQAMRTTLSATLQEAAVALLGDDTGAVVMLDPRTGEVLVLASTPAYDASAIADPVTARATFKALLADASQPLLPRATQGRYVPGSVFKIVTAIAALGSGAVTPATTFAEQPAAEVDGLLVSGFRVRDGHHPKTGAAALDLRGATEVSCNIWYSLAGLETGGSRLVDWAGRLGFGAPLPFDLPTASSQVTGGGGAGPGGFVDAVEVASASYGQAETLVTPLQMALVASTVANGGVLMRPHLVTSFIGRSGVQSVSAEAWRRVLPAGLADEIAAAMVGAVQGELGRVYTAGAQVTGLSVAGKSGTAELGGTGEPNSWFIGFAPADAPRIVVAVVVEHGGRGAERAAPIAGELLAAWKTWAGR